MHPLGRVLVFAALGAGLGVAGIPRGAAAAEERVVVWSVTATGPGAGDLRGQFYHSVTGGLAAAGLAVVPQDEIGRRLAESPGLVGCETTPCLVRVADLLRVRRIVRATVEVFGSSYVYRLSQIAADGRSRSSVDGRCDVCTIVEANDQLSRAAMQLARSPLVEDRAQPASQAAAPPPAAGVAAPPRSRAPVGPAPASEPQRPLRRLAWTATGGGLLAIAVGAILVALDGRGSCSTARGHACPEVYDTATGGWVLVGAGAAALGGAGVLFWYDRGRSHGSGGPAGGVALRFAY